MDVGVYRFAYQGQEKDPETGWEAFELRMWDGRLGRWMSVDPAGQYASPYVGMGNNPVSRVDPDGGFDTDYVDSETGLLLEHVEDGKTDIIFVNKNVFENASMDWDSRGLSKGLGFRNRILSDKNSIVLDADATQVWAYGVSYTSKSDGVGHSFAYNLGTNTIYEVQHPNNGETHGFVSWISGGPKSVGYKWDLNQESQKSSFWSFKGGRQRIELYYLPQVDQTNKITQFFISNVDKSWDYNLVTCNCKDYAEMGLLLGYTQSGYFYRSQDPIPKPRLLEPAFVILNPIRK